MINSQAAFGMLNKNQLNKSIDTLLGIVTGMISDGQLSDLEIKFLSTWLTEHADVAAIWPGSVVAHAVRTVLSDGVITESEREYLLVTLTHLTGSDFAQTGTASPEVITLPLDDLCQVNLRDANLCLTGEFLFGTRTKCESIAAQSGAISHGTVTRKIEYLVIGSKVSPHWAHTSYGRKIEQAIALQQAGHIIKIISEKRWLEALV